MPAHATTATLPARLLRPRFPLAILASAVATTGILTCLDAQWNAPIVIVLLAAFAYLAMGRADRRPTRTQTVLTALFAAYTAINLVLHTRITYSGNIAAGLKDNHFDGIGPQHILAALLLALATYQILDGLAARLHQHHSALSNLLFDSTDTNAARPRSILLPAFLAIAICWLPIWLTLYPGAGVSDAVDVLNAPLYRSSQHPFAYIVLFYGSAFVGKTVFGDINIGIAAYTAIQSLAIAAAIAYAINWLHHKGLKTTPAAILTAFFAINPLYSVFALNTTKDVWFSIFILLVTPLMFELIHTKGANIKSTNFWKYLLTFTALCLSRNNGIYVLLICGLIALALIKREYWLRWAVAVIIPVMVSLGVSAVPPMLGAPAVQTSESPGISLRQTAAVIAQDGHMTTEQRQFLFRLMPEQDWKDSYAPMRSDPIKWNQRFDRQYLSDHKGEYLVIWAQMLPRNFGTYVTSYLTATYGFWNLRAQSPIFVPYTYFQKLNANYEEIFERLELQQTPLLPRPAVDFIRDTWIGQPKRYQAPGASFEIWTVLLLALMLLRLNRGRRTIALLPVIACWATLMIATPIAFCYRYVFYLAMVLPFAILVPFMNDDDFQPQDVQSMEQPVRTELTS
ncbi:hypothetical protein H7U32_04785 [Bifidobacterium pullorum subsp. saeculare]|uniref:Uncharacterized protein n=1 Tax=Bifidobacterium pullorum subsp. saeculare TaxID=78257 RepID=A0A938WWP4_9BIFI|nr:DUF6020 family protein [Bifidobacterium pullorum]MBM6699639.1 hypothetical protein [Bifidobacterium pullorum subsp. saeculare]